MHLPVTRLLLFALAAFVFASFTWGMLFHFRRSGRLTARAWLTAAAGSLSTACTLWSLLTDPVPGLIPSAVLYALSAGLFWSAVRASRGRLAICFSDAYLGSVVTGGPYRWVRHPFYTAYTFAWLASCTATFWWPILAGSGVLVLLYRAAAREEEAHLLSTPGASSYERYMRGTGRFLPLWPRR
jgi:protein-S-isoprenylcysteine O-methyltransferase Ste14